MCGVDERGGYELSRGEFAVLNEILEDYLMQDDVMYSPYEHVQERARKGSELHSRLVRHFEPEEYERRYGAR